MKEHFLDEIGNHSSKELLEKYFPGKVYENAAIQKDAVEFCQIAEKIVGLNKTQIPFLVESQLSSMPETYHDPVRKIIGKKYITDADASKAGACQKCLEHANRIFKWPQEAHLMPKLPLHPNCKCHYENVYEDVSQDKNIKQKIQKIWDRIKPVLDNIKDSAQLVIEQKYAPPATSESVGAIQAGTLIVTEIGNQAAKTKTLARQVHEATGESMVDIYMQINDCLSNQDFKKLMTIQSKLKKRLKEIEKSEK